MGYVGIGGSTGTAMDVINVGLAGWHYAMPSDFASEF